MNMNMKDVGWERTPDLQVFKEENSMTVELDMDSISDEDLAKIFGGTLIIRCKDCKWHKGHRCAQFGLIGFEEDDFCSYAERKKE